MSILLVLFYFLFPVIIIYMTQKVKFLNKLGAVVLAYFFGLLLGNVGILPRQEIVGIKMQTTCLVSYLTM